MLQVEIKELPSSFEELQSIIQPYEKQIDILEEQIRHLRSQLFGRKSERYITSDQKQLDLFDEAEEAAEKALRKESMIVVPAHARKKPGRKPLPAELPRIQVIHDLAPLDKMCCGKEMARIGEEISEKLHIEPAKIFVKKHIRPKYACKECEGIESKGGTVKIALMPPQIIPQGIATPSLMAYIITNKFVDALPFYRQEKIFERLKIEFGRGIMAHNVIHVAGRCNPLVELMEKEIRSGPLIQIDETTVQVMKEPGRANTTKSYMWVFRGGSRDHPILIYQYHPTRSGDVAKEFIKGYKGYVQTDGYVGYDFLDKMEGITHCGCLTHVRRNFADVIKAKGKGTYRSQLAEEALDYIKEIYEIERLAKSLNYTPDQIYALRQEKAKPIMEGFKKWLDDHVDQIPPGSLLGKAFNYALNQWERVIKYLDDGILYPDNNWVENAIRPFVLGRKNWLFSGHPRGAHASATLYSLVETAKANGLESYQYLNFLFERLPYAQTEEDYRKLLPMYVKLDPIKKSEISTD